MFSKADIFNPWRILVYVLKIIYKWNKITWSSCNNSVVKKKALPINYLCKKYISQHQILRSTFKLFSEIILKFKQMLYF